MEGQGKAYNAADEEGKFIRQERTSEDSRFDSEEGGGAEEDEGGRQWRPPVSSKLGARNRWVRAGADGNQHRNADDDFIRQDGQAAKRETREQGGGRRGTEQGNSLSEVKLQDSNEQQLGQQSKVDAVHEVGSHGQGGGQSRRSQSERAWEGTEEEQVTVSSRNVAKRDAVETGFRREEVDREGRGWRAEGMGRTSERFVDREQQQEAGAAGGGEGIRYEKGTGWQSLSKSTVAGEGSAQDAEDI
eukprot:TRINITY_DN1623_c0_g4_i1.p1 TRINITY_DN1623_c0_g4~~TRINITY_DN1623_c0_g4_i1.p1  ORF type:complete len:266 (-),score=82.92 TRINITY_DN1623_c0_g4_i1:415-1149(-)